MLMDASGEGTIRTKNQDEVKQLIDKMRQNEYRSQIESGVKTKENKMGVLELDARTTLLA